MYAAVFVYSFLIETIVTKKLTLNLSSAYYTMASNSVLVLNCSGV